MNVNCSASLFKINHVDFLTPISKHCLTFTLEQKNSNPKHINFENHRNFVSGLYSLYQLIYYCVYHLEIASYLCLTRASTQYPSISGSHVFPIIHLHAKPLKADSSYLVAINQN